MWQSSDNLRALYETPVLLGTNPEELSGRNQAEKLLEKARKAGRTFLTEVESKQILGAYGVPTVESRVALDEGDAVKQAEELGFPVAVKLFSESLTHKSDVGGVQLDVRGPAAVRHAWRAIEENVTERAGRQHFLGVTVQPMIKRDGYELILGSSIDPQFGPVLMFGTGGKLVEVFKDTVVGLPPLNATLARRLMERTRIYAALKGVRGQKSVDLEALELLLVRFSQLVAEQSCISEIDINPLLVSPTGMLALDARIVMHPAKTPEELLPRLAIQPYPNRYVTQQKLKDGTQIKIRPIRPEDEPLMVGFHQRLSDRSVYLRYFTPMKLDRRVTHDRLSRICFIDYAREMALVVEHCEAKTHQIEIVGVGRLSRLHGVNEAEFALVVDDPWQGKGIGKMLLERLVRIGRDEKLDRITGIMLADNREMRHIACQAGFSVTQKAGECFAEKVL